MADFKQWLPAVPKGEQLLAAAPMYAEWRGPSMFGWKAMLPSALVSITFPLAIALAPERAVVWTVPVLDAAILATFVLASLVWRRWWQKGHPRPTGMATVVDWKRGRGPVLLVTGSGVLQTSLQTGTAGPVRPAAPGQKIPGLVAIEADEERLVLRFEDGTEARLRQRWPTPGAAARVAELAAPVLRRQVEASVAFRPH